MIENETEATRALTAFLTQPDRYRGKSPVVERVEAGIARLTTEIAAEVIAENPELRAVIRSRVADVVTRALNDDAYLNSTVIKAVSEALTRHALGTEDE
jgi:hypothetical protein